MRRRSGRGSSPLARGLRHPNGLVDSTARIIPARAGFTPTPGRRPGSPWDHPRSRGVYSTTARSPAPSAGSSPLARGLRRADQQPAAALRIIPARAGFTGTCATRPPATPDHPRSRGVYSMDAVKWESVGGSSPLARGLRKGRKTGDWEPLGSSPLARGLPDFYEKHVIWDRDHPRSRGVYHEGRQDRLRRLGSSPLARGLHGLHREDPQRRRIIPARAGFTLSRARARMRAPDHPRSRGVYT